MRIPRPLSAPVWAAAMLMAAGSSHANVLETYDAGTSDVGDWHLTTTTGYLRQIEPAGGDPNGWLHAQDQNGVAGWATSGSNPYTGDWAAEGVTGFEGDLSIISAQSGHPVEPPGGLGLTADAQPSDRAVTLQLESVGNVEAIYVGPDLASLAPAGWQHYAFDVDASSTVIPDGWIVTRFDGKTATDADWQSLMRNVDYV